jgi:hypothetical protein
MASTTTDSSPAASPATPAGKGKHALVIRDGWEGHVPVPASDRYAQALKACR